MRSTLKRGGNGGHGGDRGSCSGDGGCSHYGDGGSDNGMSHGSRGLVRDSVELGGLHLVELYKMSYYSSKDYSEILVAISVKP